VGGCVWVISRICTLSFNYTSLATNYTALEQQRSYCLIHEIAVLVVLSIFVAPGLVSSAEGSPVNAALRFQQNTNSISGHVSDDRRTPLADLRVELLNEVDSVIQTVKTDGSGLFVFRKLSDGAFQVRVETAGTSYLSQTKRVELARPRAFGAAFEEIEFILVTRRTTTANAKPGVVFVQEVPEPAQKQYQKATELLKKSEKREEGFVALKKALEIFPQYFDALELLGTEQVKHQEYEAAVPVLAKAVEINPRAQSSWFAMGVAQYNLKEFPTALESLRRSVSLNERSINANLWLGIVLRKTGPLAEAETYLKQADQLADSKLADAHWQLALLYNQLKRFKEAADELEVFLKVQPDTRDVELIKKLIQRLRQQSVTGSDKS
jgi:Flp pilus assembly protein TadD